MGDARLAFVATALVTLGGTPASAQDADSFSIKIRCSAVNDFGYVASARGTLLATGRDESGRFALEGTLRVDSHLYGDSGNRREVELQGTLDIRGQYLSADVITEDALDSMFLAFEGDADSHLDGYDGTQYQTQCGASRVHVPDVADIVPTRTLRFESLPDGQQRARAELLNVGNAPVSGPEAHVRIAGRKVHGTLHGSSSGPDLIDAGETGYIEVELPEDTLARCGEYPVVVDTDHALQSGPFDPFSNDDGRAATPCLHWTTLISDDTLGTAANPLIVGRTLQEIVSSQGDSVRADGRRCSHCHYKAASTTTCEGCHAGKGRTRPASYRPMADRDQAQAFGPDDVLDGNSWAQEGGWGERFVSVRDENHAFVKPDYLRALVQQWLLDGAGFE